MKMKHSFKEWLLATRYWALPVSLMPVLVTFCYLFGQHSAAGVIDFVLALVGVALLHSAGNVLSDYFDYKSGVDNPEAFAVPNLVFGKFQPKEYLHFSLLLFASGIVIGAILVLRCGNGLLWVGLTGVLLTVLYSFLKYRALGDLDIFIIFSILIILGTTYVVAGRYIPEALVLAIPLGIITVSVLHANNTVDIVSDGSAGIKTFAMLIGGKASAALYRAYMVVPFLWVVISVIVGWLHPFSLLCLLAFPKAYSNFKQARGFASNGIEAMSGLDRASSQLQLTFSLLLSLGLFLSFLVK